jgi:type IV pilus assembly protein PilN
MIRVNLIGADRRAVAAKPSRGLQAGQKVTLAGSLILLLAVALVGWRYWAVGQEAERIERDITAAHAEEQRLGEIIKQVQDFEARRGQLQQRVALIEDLRKGQTAPVHMLDQVSRALPEMMWLTKLTQSGYDITIEGRCLSLTALSDFVGNLEGSRYFARPVEIVNSQVNSGQGDAPDLITFTVKGTFQMAGMPPPPPPTTKSAAGAKGGKRG